MIKKENKILRYLSLISGIAATVYIWLYDRLLEPNPLYGGRADTASNVGRDHWGAFIVWGLLLAGSVVLNLNYSLEKFEIKNKKFPRTLSIISLIAMLGVVLCKNEKLKRFTLVLNFETYTAPTYTTDYADQTLATSKNILDIFWSKKSIHSAFSVIFGLCIAIAIVYLLISKAKTNKKFKYLTIAFFVFACVAAFYLKVKLGGTAEITVITCALIPMLIVNHTNIMDDGNKETECIKANKI